MNFWESRWKNGQTGWHNSVINEHLHTHHQVLFQEDNPKVLVPLCGQSLDMAWLHQQGASIGVDLVKQPLEGIRCAKVTPWRVPSGYWSPHLRQSNIVSRKYIISPRWSADAIYDSCWLRYLRKSANPMLALLSLLNPVVDIIDHLWFPRRPRPSISRGKGTIEKLFSGVQECIQLDEVRTTKEESERLQKRNLDWSRSVIWKSSNKR